MRNDPWCLGVFVDNELSWNSEPRMADVSEKYFSTISRILKDELPNHLYLGCRIAWGADVIYCAAARHCDVVSVNIYSRQPDRDLPPSAGDKPMINGEFHFGALDRGMFHTGLVGNSFRPRVTSAQPCIVAASAESNLEDRRQRTDSTKFTMALA